MTSKSIITIVLSAALAACASYPPPVQRLADANSAARAAQEIGANNTAQAQLHLKLAQEGMAHAKVLMSNGDNKRADFVLVRADSDAQLSLALAREEKAKTEAQQAIDALTAMRMNTNPGGQ